MSKVECLPDVVRVGINESSVDELFSLDNGTSYRVYAMGNEIFKLPVYHNGDMSAKLSKRHHLGHRNSCSEVISTAGRGFEEQFFLVHFTTECGFTSVEDFSMGVENEYCNYRVVIPNAIYRIHFC